MIQFRSLSLAVICTVSLFCISQVVSAEDPVNPLPPSPVAEAPETDPSTPDKSTPDKATPEKSNPNKASDSKGTAGQDPGKSAPENAKSDSPFEKSAPDKPANQKTSSAEKTHSRSPLRLILDAGAAESAKIQDEIGAVGTSVAMEKAMSPDAFKVAAAQSALPSIVLLVKPKFSENSLRRILSEMAESRPVSLIEIQLARETQPRPISAKIYTTPQTSYSNVQKCILLLRERGIEQIQFEPGTKPTAQMPGSMNQAFLLILESDWSQSPTAVKAEADLKLVLKDASIPEGLRKNLLTSGPRILFAAENVAIYQPRHCAALLKWLDLHKLLKQRLPFQGPVLGKIEVDRRSPAEEFRIDTQLTFRDEKHLMPFPFSTQLEQPFVKTRLVWEWNVNKPLQSDDLEINLVLDEQKHFQGEPDFRTVTTPLSCSHRFSLPVGRSAIIQAFASPPQAQYFSQMQDQLRKSGMEVLLLISASEPNGPQSEEPAQFYAPERVMTYVGSSPTYGRTANELRFAAEEPSPGPKPGSKSGGAALSRAPGNRQAGPSQAEDGLELKVFGLRHTKADTVHSIIQQLLHSNAGVLAVDERTNSLLARGSKQHLEEIEVLVEVLDVPSSKQPDLKNSSPSAATGMGPPVVAGKSGNTPPSAQPPVSAQSVDAAMRWMLQNRQHARQDQKGGPTGSVSSPGPTDSKVNETVSLLRSQYEIREQQAAQIARDLVEFQLKQPENQTRIDGERTRLRQAVTESFAARQRLQHGELLELASRVLEMRDSVELRERIQDQIIDSRVDDLLNPDRRWESTPPPESKSNTNTQKPVVAGSAKRNSTSDGATTVPTPKLNPADLQFTDAEVQAGDGFTVPGYFDPALQGVWGLNYKEMKIDEATITDDRRLRVVFWRNRFAVFQGKQPTRLGSFTTQKTEPSNWVEISTDAGMLLSHGPYEVKADSLRMTLSGDPNSKPDHFATQYPEFIRVTKLVPKEMIAEIETPPELMESPDKSAPAEDLQRPASPAARSAPMSEGAAIRNAVEFRKLIDDAIADQTAAERTWLQVTDLAKDSQPKVSEDELRKKHWAQWNNLGRTKRHRAMIEDELATEIKLMQIDVQTAQTKLTAAQRSYEGTKSLFDQKVIAKQELNLAMTQLELAQLAMQRATTVLELYLKINPPAAKEEPNSGVPPTR
jgi:hypothetical protein